MVILNMIQLKQSKINMNPVTNKNSGNWVSGAPVSQDRAVINKGVKGLSIKGILTHPEAGTGNTTGEINMANCMITVIPRPMSV